MHVQTFICFQNLFWYPSLAPSIYLSLPLLIYALYVFWYACLILHHSNLGSVLTPVYMCYMWRCPRHLFVEEFGSFSMPSRIHVLVHFVVSTDFKKRKAWTIITVFSILIPEKALQLVKSNGSCDDGPLQNRWLANHFLEEGRAT